MEINMLPAGSGDCFFIHYNYDGKGYNIWVDGGIGGTYRNIKKQISEIKDRNENIDLLVVTHVDADHIRGILKFFSDKSNDFSIIRRVLFNSASALSVYFTKEEALFREVTISGGNTTCSYNEGITLEKVLQELGLLQEKPIMVGDIVELPGAKINVLSPDYNSLLKLSDEWEEESSYGEVTCSDEKDYHLPFDVLKDNVFQMDTSCANQASIAFLLEQGEKKILMLSDSNPVVVVKALREIGVSDEEPLKVDCIKISHHGSCKNTSDDLMRHLSCQSYLISTSRRGYPNKETLARIINNSTMPIFYCNYDKSDILLPGEEDVCQIINTRRVEI